MVPESTPLMSACINARLRSPEVHVRGIFRTRTCRDVPDAAKKKFQRRDIYEENKALPSRAALCIRLMASNVARLSRIVKCLCNNESAIAGRWGLEKVIVRRYCILSVISMDPMAISPRLSLVRQLEEC
jgi:hypothetical protein